MSYRFSVKVILFILRCIARIPNKFCKIFGLQYLARKTFEKGKLEKAKLQAEELLALAPEFQDGFLDGNAIHHSNIILGKICLKKGNINQAKEHLLKAGQTQGSPQLDSFGPNMSLAKELLILGESSVVLEYFRLCSNFWKDRKLSEWSLEVKEGKIPEFKQNLNY